MKIFLAGAQNSLFNATLIKAKAPFMLMSWAQMRKNPEASAEKLRKVKASGAELLLDSGAHTFYNRFSHLDVRKGDARAQADRRFVKEEQTSREDLIAECETYLDGYLDFLVKHQDLITAYAEIDIDSLVGLEKVRAWRLRFLERGLNPICTYHGTKEYEKAGGTMAFVKEMAKQGIKYIAIAREADRKASQAFFTDNYDLLKKHKILVHLWGMTENTTWLKLAGYSVDSTSWLNGSKYGTTHLWVHGTNKMHLHDWRMKKKVRPLQKGYCEKNGIDFEKFLAEDDDEVNLFHACMWRDFALHLARYDGNAYWMTDKEKMAVTMAARAANGLVAKKPAPKKKAEAVEILPAPAPKAEGMDVILPTKRLSDPRYDVPRLCATCYVKEKCPEFRADDGAKCVFPASVKLESLDDLKSALVSVLEGMISRTHHVMFIEKMMGGALDPNVSRELREILGMARELKELFGVSKSGFTITAEGEAATKMAGGGVLSRIFAADKTLPEESE